MVDDRISVKSPLTRAALSLLFVLIVADIGCWAQLPDRQPSEDLYQGVQNVGNLQTGTLRTFFGCQDNGATLSSITLWANEEFIRGMSAVLTDGRQTVFGCVNVSSSNAGGCNDTDIRSASFTFQPGETVANLTLWPGYNVQKQPNQRAGAMNMVTSRGRTFDFGMTDARNNPVAVSVGSGIPCGIAPRAGADIDALGFVFLLPVSSSTLQDVYYYGLDTGQGGVSLDMAPLETNVTELVLSSQVYNNSGKGSGLVASFSAQESVEVQASWSTAPGLDSYLQSSVRAAVPQVNVTSANETSWSLSSMGSHNRSEALSIPRAWNYSVNVGPGGISRAVAQALQGSIIATFTANLSVVLASGGKLTLPVSGVFDGLSASPVGVHVTELKAATASPTSGGGSNNNKLAWALGVIFGILGGLLLAALIAWAVVIIMRRRRSREASREEDAADAADKKKASWFFIPGRRKGGDGKPVSPEDVTGTGGDVELGSLGGKGSTWKKGKKGEEDDRAWKEQPDPKLGTVVGVPASDMTQDSSPGSAGRFVVPYVMFRRLRLEAIRSALGLEGQAEEQRSQQQDAKREAAAAPSAGALEEAPGLSNPPSEASTPRAVPPAGAEQTSTAEGVAQGAAVEAAKTADAKSLEGGAPPALERSGSAMERYARSLRLKDRVAAVMAGRRNKPQEPASQEEEVPTRGEATVAPASSMSSKSKEQSILSKMARSVSSMSSSRANSSRIQHDDHIIDLRSKAKPGAVPGPDPDMLRGSSKPTTPKRPKTVEHEEQKLRLGEGYEAARDAKSVQKDAIDVDNKRIRLGVKYHTQGRNE